MKQNKTPGIDGITAEFLKVFWGKMKYFVTESLNCGYRKGELSISMRQCIITCLPNPDKDRSFIKNWRPISLLSTIYKLASAAIAERLKPSLDQLISDCQTGFIKGRQISDSTRLIYDMIHQTELKNIPGLLMLIDFEKAFDSVSWKFLYKVLSFFGYSENLIKWIKVFNTGITAYISQCGFLSKEIPIRRGCRQGDPLSPYLFLLGAEVLARLIKMNPKIIGIKIQDSDFKLTQFADDTTLILDGTQNSLQAALNTLEVFGDISGLKMNKDKTKMIWIGRKRLCKNKLKVSENLSWGSSHFTLLGLKFSTNLHEMTEINYSSTLQQVVRETMKWNYRYLTPFGKITVIKTKILSKCTHLLFSLPSCEKFLNSMNSKLYEFLWEGKPDKIKRSTICTDYLVGGLKMINVKNYEKGLKVSWVKRMFQKYNSQWFKLFKTYFSKAEHILNFGDGWCKTILRNVKNPFWMNVLENWINLCEIQRTNLDADEIRRCCIWFNPEISRVPLFLPDWYKKGIYFIEDITDCTGNILTLDQINSKFNGNFNVLNFFTIRKCVNKFLSKQKKFIKPVSCENPAYPSHLKAIINSQDGCKNFYNIYNKEPVDKPLCETIWQELLLSQISKDELPAKFRLIYKLCFKTIHDNELIWFQYRILYKILGTRDYLKKTKLTMEDECNFCRQGAQTIEHLFAECPTVTPLWENLKDWISKRAGVNLMFDKITKILGYLQLNQQFWPFNFVLMISRKYIFLCSRRNHPLNIYLLQKEIKRKFLEQETLFKINGRANIFDKRWIIWRNLFFDIDSVS